MRNFEQYVDPALTYDFTQGPDKVRNYADAARDGVNCVSLAHLVMKDAFGESLPPDLFFYEMFSDTERFAPVTGLSGMQPADLVWLGHGNPKFEIDEFTPEFVDGHMTNWDDSPIKHVGVFTGEVKDDEPMVLHACWYVGRTAVWPLSEFSQYPKYERVYGVSRYIPEADRLQTPATTLWRPAQLELQPV